MAKTFKPKANADDTIIEESSVVDEVAETVEEPKKEEEVTFNEELVQKSAVKNVKILPRVDHSCSIGGVRYYLRKGVLTNVPQDVKDILNKADLLMPL